MTMKEKARAYDEVLERARKLKENPQMVFYEYSYKEGDTICDYIFPELKETKEQMIRKDLIEWIEDFPDSVWRGHHKKDIITWLERQGGNLVENNYTNNKDIIKYADNYSHKIWRKLMDNFKNIKDYYIGCNDVSDIVLNAIIDTYNWLEKQGEGEKESTDKDEQKFNVGDWIVYHNSVYHIDKISGIYLTLSTLDGTALVYHKSVLDSEYTHFWTIADAKNGDVLVTDFKEDNIIVMYHSRCTIDTINVHCCLDNKFVCWNLGVFNVEDVKPATKEQRDLLFEKMKKACYEWDDKEKKLIKVEISPVLSNSLNI